MTERGRMLLIQTAAGQGMVALAGADGVVRVERLPGRGTSEAILPAVQRLFPDGFKGLDVVGVVNGPGVFTGVRVGLSTAKGLCEAVGCRLVAISWLALVAEGCGGERVTVLADAGRGEFYAGTYEKDRCPAEKLLTAAETDALLSSGEAVTCEQGIFERLGSRVRLISEPDAVTMHALVLKRTHAGAWSDVATTDANYLRRTDAERLKGTR